MHIERVDDAADPRLADYRNLTDMALRRAQEPAGGLYIAETAVVIARAVAAGHAPRSALVAQRRAAEVAEVLRGEDVPVYVVPDDVAEEVTGFAVHRGALASMHRPALPTVEDLLSASPRGEGGRSRIAVFEDLIEHVNVGAAFRSAAALGVDAVLLTPRCADPLYRRAIKVSMGTVFQVPWTRFESWPDGIELLTRNEYLVAGMTLADGAVALDDLVTKVPDRLALVFGTEGQGLSAAAEARVDRRVTIPMMRGVDSLNVAAAAAIAFYATR